MKKTNLEMQLNSYFNKINPNNPLNEIMLNSLLLMYERCSEKSQLTDHFCHDNALNAWETLFNLDQLIYGIVRVPDYIALAESTHEYLTDLILDTFELTSNYRTEPEYVKIESDKFKECCYHDM